MNAESRQRMTAASAHDLDVPDVIDDAHISRTRESLMTALADAVTAHIDTAIRSGRATNAVLHAITTA
jgi:hypothetical protein